eukprot:6195790-Pleurochrysis_carterae.AAC.2
MRCHLQETQVRCNCNHAAGAVLQYRTNFSPVAAPACRRAPPSATASRPRPRTGNLITEAPSRHARDRTLTHRLYALAAIRYERRKLSIPIEFYFSPRVCWDPLIASLSATTASSGSLEEVHRGIAGNLAAFSAAQLRLWLAGSRRWSSQLLASLACQQKLLSTAFR